MKLFTCLALLHFSFLCFGQNQPKAPIINMDSLMHVQINAAIGTPFQSFAAVNEEGKINNDSLKGKVVLINFWFEGCHPCIAEFGDLNELANKLKSNKDFEFISFTWDNAETIQRVKEKYKLQFKVYYSNQCSKLNLRLGYPTTMVLDRQGKIKYLTCGGSLNPKEIKEFVNNTLLPAIQKEL
jgi:peroxiredoxin